MAKRRLCNHFGLDANSFFGTLDSRAIVRLSTMIVLFTDFGDDDIYIGQVKAVLLQHAPAGTAVVDLLHSVPSFDARAGAHLLAALHDRFPPGAIFFAVIDPGVGTARDGVVLDADGQLYVGPDNGLWSVVAARARRASTWRIAWRPEESSVSFHGRDIFAPIAAWLAAGGVRADRLDPIAHLQVQLGAQDLGEVIYVDHYGNVITGLRACNVDASMVIDAGELTIRHGRVFGDVPEGTLFWYQNSIGLVEIAVNRGNAAAATGLSVGDPVRISRVRDDF